MSHPIKHGELAKITATNHHNEIRGCMYPNEMNREIIEFKHKIGEIKTSIKNFNRVKLKGFSSYEVCILNRYVVR